MRYVFVVTDDATLGSTGDSPSHLEEQVLPRQTTCHTPPLSSSTQVFFAQVYSYFILVSFIFIHLIKYQITYISLQALFSLAYFDRSLLLSPKYPLKYLDRSLLSSNLAFRQISPRWNHFLDWCLFFYVKRYLQWYNLVLLFAILIVSKQKSLLNTVSQNFFQILFGGQIVFIFQMYHSYTNEFLSKLTRMIDV